MITRTEVEQLYRSHGALAKRRARAMLGDGEAAADVAHEVFADLLERPEQFQGRSSFTTFLYAAVTHRCLQRLRDARNRTRILDARLVLLEEEPANPAERLTLLRQLLAHVPQELAEVAVYFYVDSLSYDQIAAMRGCSKRHVSDLLTRFRSTCEELLRAQAS